MKITYQVKSDNSKVNCVFDFSEYDSYPLMLTNVAGLEKENIKAMFMETMSNLFEIAWSNRN